jgi:hypothetical protein
MAGGLVAEWYLPEGASVGPGDLVCRLECEFVAVEIEAQAGGLLHHRKPAGSVERPGTVIGMLLAPGESPADDPPRPDSTTPAAPGLEPVTAASDPAAPAESGPPSPSAPPLAPGEPVVVPFRRRSAGGETASPWGAVPGDAAEFETSLFDTAEPLPVAGAAIPGLALWEPDDDPPYADAFPPTDTLPAARLSAIAAEAPEAHVLTMEVRIGAAEALRAVRVLAGEWRDLAPSPLVEDLVLRALATAIEEAGLESSPAGLTLVTPGSDHAVAVSGAARRGFRDAVKARAGGGDEPAERAAWTLVSFRECGIRAAEPAPGDGDTLAASLGAIDEAGAMSVTIAYDSSRIGPGDAARMLARVRSLVEEPYGLLSS